jgi:hypothetical protein
VTDHPSDEERKHPLGPIEVRDNVQLENIA